ncbi:MAG: sulfurtransferase [Desulfobacteraceae bacterium]|nr:MAG: sulfurtransferase [Desulfobacteraceae bacterium]
MFQKSRLLIGLMCFALLAAAGCNDSSSSPKTKSYPNSELLAEELDLAGSGVVILDARSADAYNAGHIPGALSMPWQQFSDSNLNLKSVSELETQLGDLGLTRDTRMIIYDNTTASWGASGRLFWMFEYLGCTNVRILDGGWDKWVADGNQPETVIHNRPVATFTAQTSTGAITNKEHIDSRLSDADFVVIDTRTDAEFIGWTLYGEERGGHITGAVQIPYEWYFKTDKTILDYADMKVLFESRGVTKDKEVTAYCTAGIRSAYAYFLCRLMGYERASNYDASIWDWAAANPAIYAMESLARFDKVVSPAWVKQLREYHKPGSDTDAPPEYSYDRDHKYIIFETQWGTIDDATAYKAGHIPGAIHSNSDNYENNYPRWFLLPDDQLHEAMGGMGITKDTTVIVYSDSPIFAARLWWILMYGGVEDVRFVNGGYEGWIAAGFAKETTINAPVPTVFDGEVNPDYIATTDDVFASYVNTSSVFLADVRSYDEYIGKISGYSYVAQKGRIPNAVWAYDADDASGVYGDSDGTLRSYTEIRVFWSSIGMTSTSPGQFDRDVIFYCGSGYRSALTYMYAWLMGFENIRNYSDGWEGWSTTYTEDAVNCQDSITPGWCQDPSGRPVVVGE